MTELFIFYCAFSVLFMLGVAVSQENETKDVPKWYILVWLLIAPIMFPYYLGHRLGE
jgi:hypothetical protein